MFSVGSMSRGGHGQALDVYQYRRAVGDYALAVDSFQRLDRASMELHFPSFIAPVREKRQD